MARFSVACAKLFALEGGFVNHPSDPGAETYRGISHRFHPDWVGWAHDPLPSSLPPGGTDAGLDRLAEEFYRDNYWAPLSAMWSPQISDAVGVELLDAAVHTNIGRAVEFLQEALNLCNYGGRRWADLSVDGRLGPKTKNTAELACAHPAVGESRLVFTMNIIQGAYLLDRVRENPDKEVFWLGWLRRLA